MNYRSRVCYTEEWGVALENASDCINDAVRCLAHTCEIDEIEVWSRVMVGDCDNWDEWEFKRRYQEVRSDLLWEHKLRQLRLL